MHCTHLSLSWLLLNQANVDNILHGAVTIKIIITVLLLLLLLLLADYPSHGQGRVIGRAQLRQRCKFYYWVNFILKFSLLEYSLPVSLQFSQNLLVISSFLLQPILRWSLTITQLSSVTIPLHCGQFPLFHCLYCLISSSGGNRANTIHYIANNQVIEDGDLVLMDAGCEYHGYCSDITRTWPVSGKLITKSECSFFCLCSGYVFIVSSCFSGKFSPAQRDLYNACLIIQETCIQMCRPGVSLEQIYHVMLAILGEQLKKLGLVPSTVCASDLIKVRYIVTGVIFIIRPH
jgi:hypothetical protein